MFQSLSIFFATVLFTVVSASTQCKPGNYLRNGQCIRCSAGTYSWGGNFDSCLPCPTGFYTPYRGVVDSSLCLPCPKGTTSSTDSTTCQPLSRSSKPTSLPPTTKCGKFYIPPPEGVSYFPDSTCVSPITGCPKGMTLFKWSRRAVCMWKKSQKVQCPKGFVFDSVDRCVKCETGMKLVKVQQGTDSDGFKIRTARCERCSGNSASSGGLVTKCTPCGCGFGRSVDGSKCIRTAPEGVQVQC